MSDHSARRLELARRFIEPYAERAPIAVLGGSVAQGVADRWSDCDTIVYWETIDGDWLETPRAGAGGERFTWVEHFPGNARLEQYRFGTVKADVAHVRLGWLDELIEGVLSGEDTDTTSLDVLRGVQESIVLFGEESYEPIRARVASTRRICADRWSSATSASRRRGSTTGWAATGATWSCSTSTCWRRCGMSSACSPA